MKGLSVDSVFCCLHCLQTRRAGSTNAYPKQEATKVLEVEDIMPRRNKKQQRQDVEFDAVQAADYALSPLPSPVIGDTANEASAGDDNSQAYHLYRQRQRRLANEEQDEDDDDIEAPKQSGGIFHHTHHRLMSEPPVDISTQLETIHALLNPPTSQPIVPPNDATATSDNPIPDEEAPLLPPPPPAPPLPSLTHRMGSSVSESGRWANNLYRSRSLTSDLSVTFADQNGGGDDDSVVIRRKNDDDDDSIVIRRKDDDDDDDDDDDIRTFVGTLFTGTKESIVTGAESVITNAKEIVQRVEAAAQDAWNEYDDKRHYDWREHWKVGNVANQNSNNINNNRNCLKNWFRFLHWIVTGINENYQQSDDEFQEQLNNLAKTLLLLREYHNKYGMPEKGGPKDQEYILREVTKDLYGGGAPIWSLSPVMRRVAEGLTGKRGVDFFILPRQCFIFAPSSGATTMFPIVRGYNMAKLDDMEAIAVRLASFASNTSGTGNVPISRWPKPQELRRAYRAESLNSDEQSFCYDTKQELAEEILTLASESEGLFFYANSLQQAVNNKLTKASSSNTDNAPGNSFGGSLQNNTNDHNVNNNAAKRTDLPPLAPRTEGTNSTATAATTELNEFWTVDETTRELFSRLAAIEAMESIDKIDAQRKALYPPRVVTLFRVVSSAGSCAFWFNGSWIDIIVSGILAMMVEKIGSSKLLNKQERIIFEAVASFMVGLIAGLISLYYPEQTCFGAISVAAVLDLLQGFRVVYAIMEIMSRHSLAGAADFFEGIFFTALIAYNLSFGQYVSSSLVGKALEDDLSHMRCTHGISEYWYFLAVPISAVCWSGLFNPYYVDLPLMLFHAVLCYVVSWQFDFSMNPSSTRANKFVAALVVTFSSGLVSRYTGRQALANTVAGLYVLLPGAYLVTNVYSKDENQMEGFLSSVLMTAVVIGIGAWTGSILCTPTILGINRGLIKFDSNGLPSLVEGPSSFDSGGSIGSSSNRSGGGTRRRRDKSVKQKGTGSLLFF